MGTVYLVKTKEWALFLYDADYACYLWDLFLRKGLVVWLETISDDYTPRKPGDEPWPSPNST